jgi:hypothetical protein
MFGHLKWFNNVCIMVVWKLFMRFSSAEHDDHKDNDAKYAHYAANRTPSNGAHVGFTLRGVIGIGGLCGKGCRRRDVSRHIWA